MLMKNFASKLVTRQYFTHNFFTQAKNTKKELPKFMSIVFYHYIFVILKIVCWSCTSVKRINVHEKR